MSNYFKTDLALENSEKFKENNIEIKGVELKKEHKLDGKIQVTIVKILTEEAARVMEKPVGTYITIESVEMLNSNKQVWENVINIIADSIRSITGLSGNKLIMVAGLGNRDITADSLGPRVVNQLNVMTEGSNRLVAIIPGVMNQSGMETAQILRGVASELKVDWVIAIDALAAGNTNRLNRAIQITDSGIWPGSGVGNLRQGINKETMGVPVIAIGVPMVINAATIVYDAMEKLYREIKAPEIIGVLDEQERYILSKELMEPSMTSMYVTSDNIDENVNIMAGIIGEGLKKYSIGL